MSAGKEQGSTPGEQLLSSIVDESLRASLRDFHTSLIKYDYLKKPHEIKDDSAGHLRQTMGGISESEYRRFFTGLRASGILCPEPGQKELVLDEKNALLIPAVYDSARRLDGFGSQLEVDPYTAIDRLTKEVGIRLGKGELGERFAQNVEADNVRKKIFDADYIPVVRDLWGDSKDTADWYPLFSEKSQDDIALSQDERMTPQGIDELSPDFQDKKFRSIIEQTQSMFVADNDRISLADVRVIMNKFTSELSDSQKNAFLTKTFYGDKMFPLVKIGKRNHITSAQAKAFATIAYFYETADRPKRLRHKYAHVMQKAHDAWAEGSDVRQALGDILEARKLVRDRPSQRAHQKSETPPVVLFEAKAGMQDALSESVDLKKQQYNLQIAAIAKMMGTIHEWPASQDVVIGFGERAALLAKILGIRDEELDDMIGSIFAYEILAGSPAMSPRGNLLPGFSQEDVLALIPLAESYADCLNGKTLDIAPQEEIVDFALYAKSIALRYFHKDVAAVIRDPIEIIATENENTPSGEEATIKFTDSPFKRRLAEKLQRVSVVDYAKGLTKEEQEIYNAFFCILD